MEPQRQLKLQMVRVQRYFNSRIKIIEYQIGDFSIPISGDFVQFSTKNPIHLYHTSAFVMYCAVVAIFCHSLPYLPKQPSAILHKKIRVIIQISSFLSITEQNHQILGIEKSPRCFTTFICELK